MHIFSTDTGVAFLGLTSVGTVKSLVMFDLVDLAPLLLTLALSHLAYY